MKTSINYAKIKNIEIQKCKVCGCTEYKINPSCVRAIEIKGIKHFFGCYWVEQDLCSGCVKKSL